MLSDLLKKQIDSFLLELELSFNLQTDLYSIIDYTSFSKEFIINYDIYKERIDLVIYGKCKTKDLDFMNDIKIKFDINTLNLSQFSNENKNTRKNILQHLEFIYKLCIILLDPSKTTELYSTPPVSFIPTLPVSSIPTLPVSSSIENNNNLNNPQSFREIFSGLKGNKNIPSFLQDVFSNDKIIDMAEKMTINLNPMDIISSLASGNTNKLQNIMSNFEKDFQQQLDLGNINKQELEQELADPVQEIFKHLGIDNLDNLDNLDNISKNLDSTIDHDTILKDLEEFKTSDNELINSNLLDSTLKLVTNHFLSKKK